MASNEKGEKFDLGKWLTSNGFEPSGFLTSEGILKEFAIANEKDNVVNRLKTKGMDEDKALMLAHEMLAHYYPGYKSQNIDELSKLEGSETGNEKVPWYKNYDLTFEYRFNVVADNLGFEYLHIVTHVFRGDEKNDVSAYLYRFSKRLYVGEIPPFGNDINVNSKAKLEKFQQLFEDAKQKGNLSQEFIETEEEQKNSSQPTKIIYGGSYSNIPVPHILKLTIKDQILKYGEFSVCLEPKIPCDWSLIEIPKIPIGCRVKRGRNWKWGDQDGGEGSNGFVVGYHGLYNDKVVLVYWEKTESVEAVRCGFENAIDIESIDHKYKKIENPERCPLCKNNTSESFCAECALCKECGRNNPPCVNPKMGTLTTRVPCTSECLCFLLKTTAEEAYSSTEIVCDLCRKTLHGGDITYHCLKKSNTDHFAGYDLCENCAEKERQDDSEIPKIPKPLVIALIGCSGAGKSTLANKLLGIRANDPNRFLTSDSEMGCTKDPRDMMGRWMGKSDGPLIQVVDTPGLSDPDHQDDQYLSRIAEFFKKISDGVNAFILVIEGINPRYNEYIQSAFEALHSQFGTERFWEHVIIVFSKCDPQCRYMWENNIKAHKETADKIKKAFDLKLEDMPYLHLSDRSDRNYDLLLKAIQSKKRFTCDFLEEYSKWYLLSLLKGYLYEETLKAMIWKGLEEDIKKMEEEQEQNKKKKCTIL